MEQDTNHRGQGVGALGRRKQKNQKFKATRGILEYTSLKKWSQAVVVHDFKPSTREGEMGL